ncbi:MAG: hypothetical protein OXM57_13180 [bacterium]|nr:hypothetical protein [bacterium]MDE0353630.1 hypothetical protein [bacterium]
MNRETPVADAEELAFSRTLLGYDPLEVRAFVKEANQRIARLSSPGTRIPDESGRVPEPELSGAIASAVREIDDVLESARLAAERIRNTAEVDVSDSVESAHQQAREIVAEAEDEAFTLRQVAWEAATDMLEAASSEVAELRAEAERDALLIIDDAERRAIRNLAAARRDSENVLQTARVEYDRLVELASVAGPDADAEGGGDEQVQDGEDAESATARTKRLVVQVPAANGQVEESGPPAPPQVYGTIRVIPAGSTPAEAPAKGESAEPAGSDDNEGVAGGESSMRLGWADGTRSVRLVGTPATRARVEVDAVEVAREVARLRSGSEGGVEAENGEPASAARPDRSAEPSAPARAGTGPGPGRAPGTARGDSGDAGRMAPSDDELAALFARLRSRVRRSNSPF